MSESYQNHLDQTASSERHCQTLIEQKLLEKKAQFERAILSKRTTFDDLYPYMLENPSFFWYKRYVAWTELLVLVELAAELGIPWTGMFNSKQVAFLEGQVLSGRVLDEWFEDVSHS